jgi:hypothetical protein
MSKTKFAIWLVEHKKNYAVEYHDKLDAIFYTPKPRFSVRQIFFKFAHVD